MSTQVERERAITDTMNTRFRQKFQSVTQNRTIMNAIRKNGIQAVAMNQDAVINMQHTFSHEIETGAVTSQKQSGRCWMFAGLNTMRIRVAQKCNLKSFELSQNYQMFWDKFEKANYFLETILETLDEPTDGRLVNWLLHGPVQDGGQWDMFVNLVHKYGVVPKSVMPETFHSSSSGMMNRLVTVKLREFAASLRESAAKGQTQSSLRAQKDEMLFAIWRLLCEFLGEPPEHFAFEYRDKDGEFHRDENLTPQSFCEKYVDMNLDDYISVIHAPTADKPFNHMYTVKYLGNVQDGQEVRYVNVDMDVLKQATLAQLLDNETVWFGCDVGKMADRDSGILDTALYDYEAALGVPFSMTKAQRLDYCESQMNHAMVFTGVHVVDGKTERWKVENSWGSEPGKDGYFVMSDPWFDEYMYQAVVKKSHLPAEIQQVLTESPKVLEPWDPMGSLALMR
ncbi:MAG: C1 family peptidase [Firmicutes bacterium]|nr:C1 family peptidase [Bacillota bacterium]